MKWQDIKVSADCTTFLYEGKPIFRKKFLEVQKFHSPGIAPVMDEEGAFHINTHGKPIYLKRFDRTFGFYCNRAAVVDGGKWFHLTETGQKAYTRSYNWAGNYQENLCPVRNSTNNYHHINLNGERVYLHNFIYAGDFKDGIATVKCKNGLYRHIDTGGKFINDKEFIDLGVFHKKYATAKDKKGWYHIDKTGTALYSQRYTMIEPFYNGFALVTINNNQKVIIDETGKKIISL